MPQVHHCNNQILTAQISKHDLHITDNIKWVLLLFLVTNIFSQGSNGYPGCVCVCVGGGGGGEEPVPEFLWSLCLVAYMKVPFLRERLNTLLSPNIILSFLHYNLTNICITQALTQDKQVSKSSASLCVTSKNG